MRYRLPLLSLAGLILILAAGASLAQAPPGTGFTYQGYLEDGGSPANGAYDFHFTLYDAETGGNQIGDSLVEEDVVVDEGLFQVILDFGSEAFNGESRWLLIAIRPGATLSAFTPLSPRQALTPVPYAMHAAYAAYAAVAPREDRISPPAANTVTSLTATAGGWEGAMTIGSDGLGIISYRDFTNSDLKVAHCEDTACTTVTTSTLDSTGDVGYDSAIAIGSDGLPVISYYDSSNKDLKFARCDDVACTTAVTDTLDNTGDVGQYSSITIGANGYPLISYWDASNKDLKVVHCDDAACAVSLAITVVSIGDVMGFTSIALGVDGRGIISYQDTTANGALAVAHCNDAPCSVVTKGVIDIDYDLGYFTSITIGADGLPLISYLDQSSTSTLKVAHCDDVACTTATRNTVDSSSFTGQHTSIAIGTDGLGIISYMDGFNSKLMVAHCQDIACSSVTTNELATAVPSTDSTAVTIGVDGLPLILSKDPSDNLQVVHCANTFCAPYLRRR